LAGPFVRTKTAELIFAVDVSGSMLADAKIQSLNAAVEEALPSFRNTASEQVGIEISVNVLTFGTTAQWATEGGRSLADFWWQTLEAQPGGLTETGLALDQIIEFLDAGHDLPPAIILLTDGMPTDTQQPTFDQALQSLNEHRLGSATSRAAVAIGADADRRPLEAFAMGGPVLGAERPEQMADIIRSAGTSVITAASEPIW